MVERNLKETPYSVQIAGSDPRDNQKSCGDNKWVGWGKWL